MGITTAISPIFNASVNVHWAIPPIAPIATSQPQSTAEGQVHTHNANGSDRGVIMMPI